MVDKGKKKDEQLELFTEVNSSLDDVDLDQYGYSDFNDPRNDPFSPNYESKVVCPIDDKYRQKKPS